MVYEQTCIHARHVSLIPPMPHTFRTVNAVFLQINTPQSRCHCPFDLSYGSVNTITPGVSFSAENHCRRILISWPTSGTKQLHNLLVWLRGVGARLCIKGVYTRNWLFITFITDYWWLTTQFTENKKLSSWQLVAPELVLITTYLSHQWRQSCHEDCRFPMCFQITRLNRYV